MSNTELRFRVATSDDAPKIQEFVEAAFQAEDSRPAWTADMALGRGFRLPLEAVRAVIARPDSAILMGFAAGGPLVASVEVARRGDGDLARIAMLSVDPGRQRAGLGRAVLAHAEAYGRETWGARRAGLNALSTRAQLLAWYGRNGYRETGETAPFPVERYPELDLPGDLCFVEMEKDLGATESRAEGGA
ncbi:acyl-CoA N-acyltransferase [Xylariaceae sp. FL0016]|nr:acyl-CoA N-acyltransferase [Xylariaceae sp. FL0016]